MLALVDGDIVRYRTGFASNDVSEAIACARANETMEQILNAVKATEYRVYLSDSKENNFRYKIYPRYKESREKQPKPVHHEALKLFLEQEWGAVVTPGQEADDALGIDQTLGSFNGKTSGFQPEDGGSIPPPRSTIICSIDKDLLQVPGLHYNWVRNEFKEQTYIEGLRCFYEQCLSGDRTDDVFGIQGIGAVKSKRALAGCETEEEMIEVCRGMWMDDDALLLTGRLLWVRRYEGEMWKFTTQDTEVKSQSLVKRLRVQDPSSEHGIPEPNGAPEHGSPEEGMIQSD